LAGVSTFARAARKLPDNLATSYGRRPEVKLGLASCPWAGLPRPRKPNAEFEFDAASQDEYWMS
jgi:hypothetical protein